MQVKVTTPLLKLIKSGFLLESENESHVRLAVTDKNRIFAYNRVTDSENYYPLTREGLNDALAFAFNADNN